MKQTVTIGNGTYENGDAPALLIVGHGSRDPRAQALSEQLGITRSAAGFRVAAGEVGKGGVWVVGNAPTALFELLELEVAPSLVIGLPVGFVGAAESKSALAASGLPAVANRGPKGGSAVAAAALNALIYYEEG